MSMTNESTEGTTRRIADLARIIRSKNAKNWWLTLDLLFPDEETYFKVKNSGVITREYMEDLYGYRFKGVYWVDQAFGMKATMRRPKSVGGVGETDVMGCQWHAPMYDIEIPWD